MDRMRLSLVVGALAALGTTRCGLFGSSSSAGTGGAKGGTGGSASSATTGTATGGSATTGTATGGGATTGTATGGGATGGGGTVGAATASSSSSSASSASSAASSSSGGPPATWTKASLMDGPDTQCVHSQTVVGGAVSGIWFSSLTNGAVSFNGCGAGSAGLIDHLDGPIHADAVALDGTGVLPGPNDDGYK
jgi:hypothetical protein